MERKVAASVSKFQITMRLLNKQFLGTSPLSIRLYKFKLVAAHEFYSIWFEWFEYNSAKFGEFCGAWKGREILLGE